MVWLKISALVAKYGKIYAVLVARKTCGTVSRSPEKTPCLISHKQLEISPEVLRNVHYIDTNCCRPFASLVITLLLWRSSFFIDMTVLCSFFYFFRGSGASWLIRYHFPLSSFSVSLHAPFHPGASETERRLHQKLFQNYNMKVRPAKYWEDKVTVRVGMTLSQLVSLVNEWMKDGNKHANTTWWVISVLCISSG